MILVIDTSQPTKIKLWLLGKNNWLKFIQLANHNDLVKVLTPLVEKFLKKNRVTFNQLRAIGVVRGSGTFSAQRAGLAFAKGF